MQRIHYLDGWRGCAVLGVLAAHFGSDQLINLGRFGVELFFVLSGRLMAEILFVRETPLGSFFVRRFSRVYPALLALSLVLLATAGWRLDDPTPAQTLTALTFTANYAAPWTGRSPVLDHIWSLCIEEHMYLLLGLIACVHRRRPLPLLPVFAGLAVLAIGVGAAQTALGYDYYQVYWRTDVRGASLLLGVISYLAALQGRLPAIAARLDPLVLGIAALLLNLNPVPDPIKYSLGTACLALALVRLPDTRGFSRRLLEQPLLLRVGVWSYSLYLWQQPLAKLGGPFSERLVYLGLAVVAALISFYAVEQPARRMLNRLFEPRRAMISG